ncbi:MAG: hypothetical protein IPL99_29280 [Candidatus Competibacteraceae bacterium]|nr:hypothetical protein [Candidatus Competibacteraceae bacterium]
MPVTIALPLDIPEVRVLSSNVLDDNRLLIEVESTLQTARCTRWGQEGIDSTGSTGRFGYGTCRFLAGRG